MYLRWLCGAWLRALIDCVVLRRPCGRRQLADLAIALGLIGSASSDVDARLTEDNEQLSDSFVVGWTSCRGARDLKQVN